jgi:glycosyltransferase involved in cell wall biosynthesis
MSGSPPTILILSYTHLATDPRVSRQISSLSAGYRVIAAGLSAPSDHVSFVQLSAAPKGIAGKLRSISELLGGRFDSYYWRLGAVVDALAKLGPIQPDVVLANDIDMLPVALKVAGRAPVVFDAHEYAPAEFDEQLAFRLFYKRYRTHLCRAYMPRTTAAITVSDPIADEYEKLTGVRPHVITNAPRFHDLRPSRVELPIRLVHHGGAMPTRKLESMIEMMDHLDDRFELNFVLTGSEEYKGRLRALSHGKRVIFHDPVPMPRLPEFLNQFDVGVYLLPPSSLNNHFALPNKLFEFIQARLAVVVGPSPAMAKVVMDHGVGRVADAFTPQAMADALRAFTPEQIGAVKLNAGKAAQELNAEKNMERLRDIVDAAVAVRAA